MERTGLHNQPINMAQAREKSKGDKRKTQYGADEEDDGEEIYGHADLYACYKPVQKYLIDSFQKRLLDSLKNSEMLDRKFEEFPKGMCHPHVVGSDPKNTNMNRFKKLCAYDKNRVILRRPRNDPGTDYINANWIKGVDNNRAYIATQGPRRHTVGDLWWMVWQEDVTQIVMLTNCKEDGRDKCDQYWPEAGEDMTCGHVVVSSQGEDQRADFTVRTFLIHLKEDKHTERTVYQYHYVTWPDHGVPAAGSLVNYWRYVTARAHTKAPPVIHCSAGVGRTGTYIALDIAMTQKSRGDDVNIFDIVMELREQRSIMVQTVVQYKFLHEVVLEAYTSRDTRMKAEQLDAKFTTDIHLDQPNNIIDQEFKLLKEMKEWAKPNHTTAQLAENKDKNRDPNVLPVDDCMKYLSVYVRGRNQYINAVSLSSFKVKRGLLLTQLPLPSTLGDLWRLVDGCDVNTILSLGGKNDEKTVKNFCRYWPLRTDEELNCDPYVVTLSSLLRVSPNINIVSVMMTHKEKSQTVKIVQYTDWDGEFPGSISDVLYLINAVAEASDVSDVPVVIQCLDGATRSGLFSVLYDVITHMTQDEELDIFSTVRQVQCVRREAVASEKHYRYCYKVAQEFKKSRSIYANT